MRFGSAIVTIRGSLEVVVMLLMVEIIERIIKQFFSPELQSDTKVGCEAEAKMSVFKVMSSWVYW